VADVTRYAGYSSPSSLTRDPTLSVADKLGALKSWRRQLFLIAGERDTAQRRRLIVEISRALLELGRQ
jgi:hypothetical protein